MSISVTKVVNLPQAALKFLVQDENEDEPVRDYKTVGGVLSDAGYAWLASGPRLEIVHTRTGSKVGAWTFGWVLKDSTTEVVCVDEIQRPKRLPLLAVGLDCDFSGGMICIFDFVTSKIIRAIHIKDKITSLHVIDGGYDVFTLPGPLRNFDGVIAVGTAGGNVFLVDICRQICDEALTTGGLNEIRDELDPCLLCDITIKDLGKIENQKEFAVTNSQHLAIHLNVVFDKSKHFILKGPKGDDRIHVNKEEVAVSALYYCPQLGSLLIGYNFGALQLYNLMTLELVYTSPVCDEHIPISHFAVQEPADDPRAVCYVWAIYSTEEECPTCLPLAVMYAFCYQSKEYHEGYGCLYQEFSNASVQYQMELGVPPGHNRTSKKRGGVCLKLKSIIQGAINREGPHHDSNEDILTLCVFVWNVWFSSKETDTFLAIFDLNQWYKEQMPNVPKLQYSSTYMLQLHLNDLINSATNKSAPILDVYTNNNSIQQFRSAQRLEEHFYPNSITFGMTCLRENDVIFLHNYGVQKALLAQIESLGPLCLVEPAEIYQEVIALGLVPLFTDLPVNTPISTNQQREIILEAALENHLMGWLCKCASEWANGSFLSAGCSLDLLIRWAFQRAVALKTNCDNFCTPLFDYSEARPDNNTNILLNSCTRQLKNLYSLYTFILKKLSNYISNYELVMEQYKSLETVSVYFEVLQWLLNVGLLPECPLTAYPRSDDLERINAPYPAEALINFYNHRRTLLKIVNEENFACSESALFIDALIERECGGNVLQEQWRSDGGNGLYPPPSLQALLRTYLIDNVDLSYKHSVIIYVFLDLAMTLDQDRYKPVITHLIKFPAVFKVSPSLIKITQAFWQLDHSDFNTAMGLLLDPLILSEDLRQWHHKLVLRALMLQKQHNFALLYVQVRKPVLTDDDDILTAISLYVANNMLDEAFYFEKHCINQKQEEKFLCHLFNECRKNDKLKSIIYRSLNSADENFFLTYLTNSKLLNAEDLCVYYHILRSHFIEAFESHEGSMPRDIESQGLLGQENAIPRERLIHSLKKLLPDVNRRLLSLCHKEKTNTWQQVSRPTPMSVFVHNITENVQYKSTIIGAALAKAKQTFTETLNQKFKFETEGTPFLRTPTVTPSSRRSSAVIVNPKIVDMESSIDDSSSPSVKRMKLSPRFNSSMSVSIPTKLDTPLVKRKSPRTRDGTEERKVVTPHSILKVKSLMNHVTPKKDGDFEDNLKEFEKIEYTPVLPTSKKSVLGLSPRKSLPVVRFQGLKSSSSSSIDKSLESPLINITTEKMTVNQESSSLQLNSSSKNTSTEDEVFYSPDTSLEEKVEKEELPEIEDTSRIGQEVEVANTNKVEFVEGSTNNDVEEKEEISEETLKTTPVFSPTRRRSYKKSLGQTIPVRSSPRLSRNASVTKESSVSSPLRKSIQNSESVFVSEDISENPAKESTSISEKTEEKDESITEFAQSPSILPKLRPRRSLCRKVLESNAFNRSLSSTLDSSRGMPSITPESLKAKSSEEVTEKIVLESKTKYEDGEEIHHSSFFKKSNLSTTVVESDVESSEDVSFDYGETEELPLSDSMRKYINTSYKASSTRNSLLENSDINETSFKDASTTELCQSVESEKVLSETNGTCVEDNKKSNTISLEKVVDEAVENHTKILQESQIRKTVDEEVLQSGDFSKPKEKEQDDQQSENVTGSENLRNKDFAFDGHSVNNSKSIIYSDLESSVDVFSMSYDESSLKLSDSMVRYINKYEENVQEVEKRNEEAEVMEVDDDVEIIEHQTNETEDKGDALVYANLENSKLNETETESNTKKVCEEPIDEMKEKVETFESDNNGPVDPQMNVFEISDDLSFNDGFVVEKEVTLEENDLCYGQQNTLENVLEENRPVSSNPADALEKNVFNESFESEEESNVEEEEDQEEPVVEEENEELLREKDEDKPPESEVIEIGSSSDDNSNSKNESSSSQTRSSSSEDESDEEKLNVSYEKNIYDSDEYSRSNEERHYSEVSESESENSEDEHSEEGCGLFEGDIICCDDDEEERKIENRLENENSESEHETGIRKKDESAAQEDTKPSNEVVELKDDNNPNEKDEVVPDDVPFKEDAKEEPIRESVVEQTEIKDGETRKVDSDGLVKFPESKITKTDVHKSGDKSEDAGGTDVMEDRKPVLEDTDVSVEMEALSYSIQDEKNVNDQEVIQQEVSVEEKNEENISDGCSKEVKEEGVKDRKEEGVKDSQPEVNQSVTETVDEPQTNIVQEDLPPKDGLNKTIGGDPLDVIDVSPIKIISNAQKDVLVATPYEKKTRSRTRSASVSSTVSAKSEVSRGNRSKSVSEVIPKQRKRTTAEHDVLEDLNVSSPKCEPDILEDLPKAVNTGRTLRLRRGSTEEKSTLTVTLRKRSASVHEIKTDTDENARKKEVAPKRRGRRAASVVNLPEIPEEDDATKKAKSVVEGYSMSRRVTRQQVSLLKKIEDFKYDLDSVDPIVLLDRVPFEGKPDPEERKVYESSPSTTNSTASSPVKRSSRLRSASVASERSERSKSKTPVRSVRSRTGTKSTDEESTSKNKAKDKIESVGENLVSFERRVTRSRTRSMSSDDSILSDSVTTSSKRQKRGSQKVLPKIEEEPAKKEKSPVPKKRTRKNSSQI